MRKPFSKTRIFFSEKKHKVIYADNTSGITIAVISAE